jgi:hypothetical protein
VRVGQSEWDTYCAAPCVTTAVPLPSLQACCSSLVLPTHVRPSPSSPIPHLPDDVSSHTQLVLVDSNQLQAGSTAQLTAAQRESRSARCCLQQRQLHKITSATDYPQHQTHVHPQHQQACPSSAKAVPSEPPTTAPQLTSLALSMARLSSGMAARFAPISSGALTRAHSAKCDRCCARLHCATPTCVRRHERMVGWVRHTRREGTELMLTVACSKACATWLWCWRTSQATCCCCVQLCVHILCPHTNAPASLTSSISGSFHPPGRAYWPRPAAP